MKENYKFLCTRTQSVSIHWLGEEDSNLRTQIQSLVSCR